MRSCLVALGLVLPLAAPAAWGWGREGHKIIAKVAYAQMNGKARAMVAELLERGETLESVAAWADEVRPRRPETGPWHFVNVGIREERADWRKVCPEAGCVARAVGEMAARVKDGNLSREQRGEALKFLVHFVGDIHQPLHVADAGDRGGNGVAVVFFDRPSNLHSIWDTPILMKAMEQDRKWRARMEKRAGYFERRRLGRGGVDEWVSESWEISRKVAYVGLGEARPVVLGQAYQAKALAAVELQLRRAGVRLGRMLDEVLGR